MTKKLDNFPITHGRISSSRGRTRNHVHFADFIPKGLPWLWTHSIINIRHFVKDYSLAVVLTLGLILFVSIVLLVRVSQQASLANLLAGVTTITQDYVSFKSNDKADAPQRGDTSGDPGPAPTGATTSFAVNSGGTTTTNPDTGSNNNGGGTTTPPPVFAVAIGFFRQDSAELECGGLNQNKPNCSRRYSFSAGVNSQNGPGNVSYGWRSNFSGASEDGAYTAGSGTASQTLTKSILIPCLSPGSYSMQFVVLSPSQIQSSTLTVNHNCTGI